MAYNLKYKQAKTEAFKQLSFHSENGHTIEIKHLKDVRTSLQNRALHLYFKNAANALVEVGYNYNYVDAMTGELMEIPYTKDLFKEFIWKPLQNTMFQIESTTKLTTKMINDILQVLSPWLAEKNKYVKFPNKIDFLLDKLK